MGAMIQVWRWGRETGTLGSMSDDLNTLVMGQAPQSDAYLYRALYHQGTMMADALRAFGSEEDEEDEEGGGGIALPAADWTVIAAETLTFGALQERYAERSIWGILQFVEQPGGMFVLLDHAGAKALCGIPENRAFSDDMIEQVDEVVRRVSTTFTDQWADIFSEGENQHGTFPEMPELAELQEVFMGLAATTPIAVLTFRVMVPSQPMARVMFGIPQPYLLPYSDSLQVAAENTYVQTGGEDIDERLANLGDVPVPVRAYLGATTMTVQELHGLEEEDVIVLEQRVADPLVVELGNGVRLMAQPGTSPDGYRKAVQIVRLGAD